MMRIILTISFIAIAAVQSFGFQNHRYPISPLLYYSALPAPVHSEVSSELSLQNSGTFSYAFSQNAQQGISLSAPHFHIFSAREKYFEFQDDPKDISDSLKKVHNMDPSLSYKRMYFFIGTSVSLHNLGMGSENFNVATGLHYMSRSLDPTGTPGNPLIPKIILERALVPSVTLRYNNFQTSLLYSDYNITTKAGFNYDSWQAGSKLTIFSDVNNAFEIGLAGQKSFYSALTVKVHIGAKWLDNEIYQQAWAFSTSIRLRPFDAKTDPSWLRYVIDPFQFDAFPENASSHPFAHFFYNIEIAGGVYNDAETKDTFSNMSISKWF